LPHPCEPYPEIWSRNEKNDDGSRKKVLCYGMRIYDSEYETEQSLKGSLGAALQEAAADGAVAPSPNKKRKKASKPAEAAAGDAENASSSAAAPGTEKPKVPEKPKEPELPQVCPDGHPFTDNIVMFCGMCGAKRVAEKPPEAEEAARESGSDSSEESSEDVQAGSSDSDSSDSSTAPSGSAASPPPKAAQAPAKVDKAKANEAFKSKIREKMQMLAHNPTAMQNAILKVKESFTATHEQQYALTRDELETFLQSLQQEFQQKKPGPKQPAAPPPKHLQAKAAGSDSASASYSHRKYPAPSKSKLRPMQAKWGAKNPCRISYPQDDAGVDTGRSEIQVKSWRASGESLWFQQPGAIVMCDDCGNTGPQTNGSLQGSEGKSQFAQNKFVCFECIGNQQAYQVQYGHMQG